MLLADTKNRLIYTLITQEDTQQTLDFLQRMMQEIQENPGAFGDFFSK